MEDLDGDAFMPAGQQPAVTAGDVRQLLSDAAAARPALPAFPLHTSRLWSVMQANLGSTLLLCVNCCS
jgi:hypothetical protein